MSTHFTDEEWEAAHLAHAEVRERAFAEGRKYTRAEVADRIAEIRAEWRKAEFWKARALRAESILAAASLEKQPSVVPSLPGEG